MAWEYIMQCACAAPLCFVFHLWLYYECMWMCVCYGYSVLCKLYTYEWDARPCSSVYAYQLFWRYAASYFRIIIISWRGRWQVLLKRCYARVRLSFQNTLNMIPITGQKITLPNTDYAHKNITSNFSRARSTLPEDGSQRIRNMSEF